MRDRRCFVQFIHPGGEHRPDSGDVKSWNVGPHRRKFLRCAGRYRDGGRSRQGELAFWGEWEPESYVVARLDGSAPGAPRYMYEPYYVMPRSTAWRQNTDPFVFGDRFVYTGCLQHTSKGATQLRHLVPGSLILFGSCFERSRFVIDTVFVVANHVDHTERTWRHLLDGRVSETYRAVTMEQWYKGDVPEGRSFRLYFGATPEDPVHGMFSFFPCLPDVKGATGFARPAITLPGFVTPHLTQGKKIARDLSADEVRSLWGRVVRQVEREGMCLGTYAALPCAVDDGPEIDDPRCGRRSCRGEPIASRPSCRGSLS